jgi:hypothetical protein
MATAARPEGMAAAAQRWTAGGEEILDANAAMETDRRPCRRKLKIPVISPFPPPTPAGRR